MHGGADEATTRDTMESIADDASTGKSNHGQLAAEEMEAATSGESSKESHGEIKVEAAHFATESNSNIDESSGKATDNVDCSAAAENCVEHDCTKEDHNLEDKQISALMEHKKQRHQQLLMQHINQLRQLQNIHKIQQRKRQLNDVPYSRPTKPQREPRQDQWLQEHRQKRKQNLKQQSKQQQKQSRQQLQKEKQLLQVNEPSHDPDHCATLPCDGKSDERNTLLDMSCTTITTTVDQTESQCNTTEPVGSESKRKVESTHYGNDMLYGPTSAVRAKSSTSENCVTTSEDDVSDAEPRQTLLEETPAEDAEVSQSTACENSSTCTPSKTQADGLDDNTSEVTEEKDGSDSSKTVGKSAVENLKDLPSKQSVDVQGDAQLPHKTEGTDEVGVATITVAAVSENTAETTVDVTHTESLQNPRVAGEDNTDDTVVTCGTAVTIGKISPDKLLHDIKMMEIQIRSISKRDQAASANKQRSPAKDAGSSYSNALHLCSSAEDKTRSTSLTDEDNIRSQSLTNATSGSVEADRQKGCDQNGQICEDDALPEKVNDEASQINSRNRPGRSLLDSGFDGGAQPAHEEDIKFVPLSTSFTVIEPCDQPSEDVDSDSFLANQHHQRKRWIDSDWGHVLADTERRAAGKQPPTNAPSSVDYLLTVAPGQIDCSADYLLTVAPAQIGDEESTRQGQTRNGSHHPRGSPSSPERSQRTARSASPLRRPVVFCPPISTDHDTPLASKMLSCR